MGAFDGVLVGEGVGDREGLSVGELVEGEGVGSAVGASVSTLDVMTTLENVPFPRLYSV